MTTQRRTDGQTRRSTWSAAAVRLTADKLAETKLWQRKFHVENNDERITTLAIVCADWFFAPWCVCTRIEYLFNKWPLSKILSPRTTSISSVDLFLAYASGVTGEVRHSARKSCLSCETSRLRLYIYEVHYELSSHSRAIIDIAMVMW